MRARDATQSIRRWGARDVFGRLVMARTVSLDAIDDKNFRLRLREPYPVLLDALAKVSSNVCFVMREKNLNRSEPGGNRGHRLRPLPLPARPASVGQPRGLREVQRLRAAGPPADGYAGGKVARAQRVEWQIIPDASTQANALTAGEVDILNSPSFDLLRVLRRNRGVTVAILDKQGWMGYMRPNHLLPPFNDLRARQALAHLVNQADYLRAAAADPENFHECRAFLVCGSAIGTEAGMEAYAQPDLEKAKALMAATGYNGEPITVLHPTDNPILGGLSEVTIGQLRKIGVNVQVAAQDLASAFARRANRGAPSTGPGWHIFHTRSLGVELNNPLTSFALASPCDTDAAGNRTGWFGWSWNAKIEELRAAYATATDAAQRKLIGVQLQQENRPPPALHPAGPDFHAGGAPQHRDRADRHADPGAVERRYLGPITHPSPSAHLPHRADCVYPGTAARNQPRCPAGERRMTHDPIHPRRRTVLAAAAASAIALPALAQARPLVVVTSFSRDVTGPIVAAFEKKHPDVKVQIQNRNTAAAVPSSAKPRAGPHRPT